MIKLFIAVLFVFGLTIAGCGDTNEPTLADGGSDTIAIDGLDAAESNLDSTALLDALPEDAPTNDAVVAGDIEPALDTSTND